MNYRKELKNLEIREAHRISCSFWLGWRWPTERRWTNLNIFSCERKNANFGRRTLFCIRILTLQGFDARGATFGERYLSFPRRITYKHLNDSTARIHWNW
jgi:hypothetical protein